jgi:guanylate kinase
MPPGAGQSSQLELPDSSVYTPIHPGLVICLTSISAGGKSYTAKELTTTGEVNPHYTETDRPMRPDESDNDYDHHFISAAEFDRRQRLGSYLVQCTLYGNRYGLPGFRPPKRPEAPTLLLAKPTVVPKLRTVLPCMVVYAIESRDSCEALVARMRERGQSEADIAVRVARARSEENDGRQVADPKRLFVAPGHPKEVLDSIRAALAADYERHQGSCRLQF